MANVFVEKATKYVDMLDEIYKTKSKTAFLEVPHILLKFDGTKFVKMPKVIVDGAADYNRGTGYNVGSTNISYSSHEIKYDRGRKFGVDILDDDEAAFQVFATISAEYVRTKQVPEVDAIRFSEIADKAITGNGTLVSADLAADQIVDALDTAIEVLVDEHEVDEENLIIFISNPAHTLLKNDAKIDRKLDVGTLGANDINRKVKTFDDIPLIKVPKGRFYDKINLNDGVTAGEESGGFETIAATSRQINFIVADRKALNAVTKAKLNKIFGWQENQSSDENIATYRNHHDLIVPENKEVGIYVHRKSTTVA
jgi:hypothetical protein